MSDLLGSQYSSNNNIRFKTPMLRSDLSDYSDVHVDVKGKVKILATAVNQNDKERSFI